MHSPDGSKDVEARILQSETRGLAYDKKFRDILRRHPGLVGEIRSLFDKALSLKLREGVIITGKTISLRVIARRFASLSGVFEVEGTPYFIKICSALSEAGYQQFMSYQEAKKIEKEFPNLEIIPAFLGYADMQRVSFYVSEYRSDMVLEEYLRKYPEEESTVIPMFLSLRKELLTRGFQDVNQHNFFYDPDRKKFIWYDIFHESYTGDISELEGGKIIS